MAQASVEIDGKTISVESGTLAKQADGAVCVRLGDTIILATAVAAAPREGINFFPLTVDFEEKMYAAGRIPGTRYLRREGRPGENAIITGRRIDRPIRPLFPKGFRGDTQIIVTVLSVDPENPPDMLGMIGASAALGISSIPFLGPVGAVRVGRIGDRFIFFPTYQEMDQSDLDLVLVASNSGIMMLEMRGDRIPEEMVLQAIDFGWDRARQIIALQERLAGEIGRPKQAYETPAHDLEIAAAVEPFVGEIHGTMQNPEKQAREGAMNELTESIVAQLAERFPDRQAEVRSLLEDVIDREFRRLVLEEGRRPDGRGLEEVRAISCEVGLLPRAHGSALFTRGQTQVMTVATLGGVGEEQLIEDLGTRESKRFIHHYNFPPFSVGEVRPLRGPSRRDIGHGVLVERALQPLIPEEEDFPYTIRLVSEVLESNGSSSMAAVCAGTLALMDAGIPIGAAVAGVSIGMVSDGSRRVLLTDIQGVEDFTGDMDCKIAGTREGLTAIQMDVKLHGLPREVLAEGLAQARRARLQILDRMAETIAAPRPELAPHAPRVFTLEIHPDRIGDLIGPGGKTIKKLEADLSVDIDVEQDGRVFILATDQHSGELALKAVEDITRDLKIGETYTGKVVRITDFGAFVELMPGRDGLVHISQLARERVEKVEDVVNMGDEVVVKIIDIDPKGKVRLSRKELLPGGAETRPGEGDRGPSPRRRPR